MTDTDLISTLPPRPETAVEKVRRRLPLWLLPFVMHVRYWMAWSVPAVRADARRQMRFLLEQSGSELDLETTARRYVKRMIVRGEQRWHPELIGQQRVKNIERLVAARDQGRGVVLSFMHHAEYDGAAGAIERHGVPIDLVVYDSSLQQDSPGWVRQHLRLVSTGRNRLVSTGVGAKGMLRMLQQGSVLGVAADVPGTTPVTFCGQSVLGPSGAARLSLTAGAPVVLTTFGVDRRGPFVQIHEPLLPKDFDSADGLLAAILEGHERAVLDQPEAVDLPLSRWAFSEGPR
jgi:lauroyl/myristoyl acyltransferase